MKEEQIITLENGKKYFVRDRIDYMGSIYLYLVRINDSLDNFMNEFIIRKQIFENGIYSLVELTNAEIAFLSKELGIN